MEYLRQLQADDDVRAETFRAIGGLLLALAALVIAFRKSGSAGGEEWSDLAILIILVIPTLILFAGGLAAAQSADVPRPWHAAWVVFGVVLLYLSTQQLIEVVEGNGSAPLNVAWTFAVVAIASVIAARQAWVRFGWLAAGLAATVTWFALWDELLNDGIGASLDTFRILCMIATGALVIAAIVANRRGVTDKDESSELVTAAGVVFVLGAGIVSASIFFSAALAGFDPSSVPVDTGSIAEPDLFWDVALLLGSLALIAAGNLIDQRGPVYVGAVGLALFVVIVGTDLDNPVRDGSLAGWPVVLVIGALVALALSLLGQSRSRPERPNP
jgi:hypothetical protein